MDMINTGLSVTTCNHLIALSRDEATQQAQVTVHSLTLQDGRYEQGPPQLTTEIRDRVLREAVQLAERAARFLGRDWTVREWEPKEPKQKVSVPG